MIKTTSTPSVMNKDEFLSERKATHPDNIRLCSTCRKFNSGRNFWRHMSMCTSGEGESISHVPKAPYRWGVRQKHFTNVSRIRSWKHLCHWWTHPAGRLQTLLPETLPQVQHDRGEEECHAGDGRTSVIIPAISAKGWSTWSTWEQHVYGRHV